MWKRISLYINRWELLYSGKPNSKRILQEKSSAPLSGTTNKPNTENLYRAVWFHCAAYFFLTKWCCNVIINAWTKPPCLCVFSRQFAGYTRSVSLKSDGPFTVLTVLWNTFWLKTERGRAVFCLRFESSHNGFVAYATCFWRTPHGFRRCFAPVCHVFERIPTVWNRLSGWVRSTPLFCRLPLPPSQFRSRNGC